MVSPSHRQIGAYPRTGPIAFVELFQTTLKVRDNYDRITLERIYP